MDHVNGFRSPGETGRPSFGAMGLLHRWSGGSKRTRSPALTSSTRSTLPRVGCRSLRRCLPAERRSSRGVSPAAWPSTETFNVAITPPAGTKTGTYSFHIDIIGDGVVLGTVLVTEQVTANQVVTPLKVSVDVKPGSCPNPLELKDKGVLPVAILGDATLKVSSIDPKSILLSRDGGTTGAKPVRWSIEDVGSPSTRTCSCGFKAGKDDRKQDLSLKFDTQDVIRKLGITKSDGCLKVYVTGTLKSSDPNTPGQQIQGWDFLQVSDSGHGTCGGADSKDDQGSGSYGGSGNSWGSGNDRGSSDNGGFPGDSDHR